MKKLILLWMLVIMLPLATGLGIAPAEKEVFFQPGLQDSYDIKVVDRDPDPKTITLAVEGELSEYITLSQDTLRFEEGEDSKTIRAEIDMPESLEPGPHVTGIVASEETPERSNIATQLSVKSKLTIFSPYPEKFLRAEWVSTSFKKDKEGNFIIRATNLGEESIEEATATIDISEDENVLKSLESNTLSITPREEKLLNAKWTPKMEKGAYQAEAIIRYDDKTTTLSRGVSVGEQTLKVMNISVEDFDYQGEVELALTLKNDWNEPIEEGYAEIEFFKGDESFGGSPTVITSFEPREEKPLRAVWDSSRAAADNYEILITLNYDGKARTESYDVILDEKYITIEPFFEKVGEKAEIPLYAPLIALLIIVVLLIIIYVRTHHHRY